jgi:hypothetical protein
MGCSDFTVVSKLMKGELPAPLDASTLDKNKSLNKKLRQLVKKCWSINPEQRPRCPEILREIENIPIIRQSCGPNRVTTRNSPGCPGFLLRTPGSTFSTNLNQGQKILEELYHGPFVSCSWVSIFFYVFTRKWRGWRFGCNTLGTFGCMKSDKGELYVTKNFQYNRNIEKT